jgi:putative ABC transport system permease protein
MTPDPSALAGFGGPPDVSLLQAALTAGFWFFVALIVLALMAVASLPIFFAALFVLELLLKGAQTLPDPIGKYSKIGGLVFRSLRRNLLRTSLTYGALFVLTGILTFIYGIVTFLGDFTADKEGQQMVILTEKFGIPSQMPPGYAKQLEGVIEKLPPADRPRPLTTAERREKGLPPSPLGDVRTDEVQRLFAADPAALSEPDKLRLEQFTRQGLKDNLMTWSFVGASIDPTKFTSENNLFFFALDPDAVTTGMMSEQGLNKEDLGEADWAKLIAAMDLVKQDKRNIVIGEDRLKIMNLSVGQEVKFYSTNYKEVEFECKIVAAFPAGSRLGTGAAMQYEYLASKLDEYEVKKGKKHPVADRSLNLVWVRMPNKPAFERLAGEVNNSKNFERPVKMETFSAAVGSFLEPYKDIFWGMKYIIMPAIVAIMCLVIGITITIGVRERRAEMAVMKVLGFQPWQVMGMVVSEAVLVGVFGGMLSTWAVYFLPKLISAATRAAGVKFAFFDNFKSPVEILIYGPLLGIAVGLIGSVLPSWNARKVKVSEVFAQVA